MARPLRIEFAGALYHVTARGDRGEPIYDDAADRRAHLDILAEVVEQFNWRCHAYCLMGRKACGGTSKAKSAWATRVSSNACRRSYGPAGRTRVKTNSKGAR